MSRNDGPRTLFDKVWDRRVVRPESADAPAILYVDLHLVHEVTSPQAFSELVRSHDLASNHVASASPIPDTRKREGAQEMIFVSTSTTCGFIF